MSIDILGVPPQDGRPSGVGVGEVKHRRRRLSLCGTKDPGDTAGHHLRATPDHRARRRTRAHRHRHQIPYSEGGPTSTDNLGPVTRTHHRIKTHDNWEVRQPNP
ncbi:hypothetical protein GCM10025786_22610 [Nocardioides caeni]